MTIEFSQFANAGVAEEGSIIVGLAGGVNARFTFPAFSSTTWNIIDSNITMTANNGYVVNSMGAVVLDLPTDIALGETFEIAMFGSGSFIIQCASGQQIRVGNAITSVAGSITSSQIGDVVRLLVCTTTQLMVLSGVTGDFALS
jgi:hypothetical protein